MLYFSGFQLDLKRKILTCDGQVVDLTKKTYDLLCYLAENPEQVLTKDDLITHVWNDRVVSGNTIDQTTSKLRKILSEYCQEPLIESVYGQGIKWTGKVSKETPKPTRTFPFVTVSVSIVACLSLLVFGLWFFSDSKNPTENKQPALLLQLSSDKVDWEVRSASQFLQQLISYSSQSSVQSVDDRPQFVLSEDFIKNQQKLIPNLTIITIKPLADQKQMAWLLEVTQAQELLIQSTVVAEDYQSLMTKSSEILIKQLGLSEAAINGLLPQDDYVMSLYVRGLQSLELNELAKAQQQFNLATQEQPSFHLARLKLAESLNQLGQIDESITALDTLLSLNIPAAIKVAATTLKVRILKVKGDYPKAAALYENLFNQQINAPPDIWHSARIEYAAVLNYMNQTQESLNIYDSILSESKLSESFALLAKVRVAKASLLQKLGDPKGALFESEQALRLFEQSNDVIGMARTYSVLARIANQRAQYKLAEEYLRQALTVTESVGHKLGEGAILNELIYTLMVQGKHQEAWTLNNKLLAIGTELDYSGMQMAAYQAFYEMSRIQKNWDAATRWWESYKQLANDLQDDRRMAKAQLFHINLLLDQNISNDIPEKISVVQSHINLTNEDLMQPALDVFRGRYQWLKGQQSKAIETIIKARALAESLQDFETYIAASNHLASYYLSQNDPQLALNTLAQSEPHKPFAIPYLTIKAEALLMQEQDIKALEVINQSRQEAAELWGPEQQALLQKIQKSMNNETTTP